LKCIRSTIDERTTMRMMRSGGRFWAYGDLLRLRFGWEVAATAARRLFPARWLLLLAFRTANIVESSLSHCPLACGLCEKYLQRSCVFAGPAFNAVRETHPQMQVFFLSSGPGWNSAKSAVPIEPLSGCPRFNLEQLHPGTAVVSLEQDLARFGSSGFPLH
jgi:hypothetical protein